MNDQNPPAPTPPVDEEKARLDRVAKMLINKDLELQKAYDHLEEAFAETKRERDRLLVERNKLAHVMSGIADGVVALDTSGNIAMFNQAAERLTGLVSHNVVGKPFDDCIRLMKNNQMINERLDGELKSDEQGSVLKEKEVQLQTGTEQSSWADILVTRIDDSQGVNVGYIMAMHDITQERELEEMKLDFVSMAAHELRTPLTSIIGYLEVFVQANQQSIPQNQMPLLNRINISAQRLQGLIENLLSVTKIERGMLTMSPEPIDWVQNVKHLIEDFQLVAKEQSVNLHFHEPTVAVPKLHVDIIRINEVLSNLISNAINYTQRSGDVEVGIEVNGADVTTYVKDNGPGIPQEAIPHLFTKFFRVSGKLEQGSKGTGLGLYISKVIVEMHKGKIWVESIFGKGSTFKFTLRSDSGEAIAPTPAQ